ncbi:hypothetical protein JCM8097_004829 [Rhodosporidiobolus ruineniae]
MIAQFQADSSEYYLQWPSQGELSAYRRARLPAFADPLEKGVLLDWTGPGLHPDTLPPADYPLNDTPEATPNPPRPVSHPLLAPGSPSQGGTGWSLRLVEPLQEGVDTWSQVWVCEAVRPDGGDGGEAPTVVLKLRQQTLFPAPREINSDPENDFFNWYPASHLIKREALAYSRLRSHQGRDIPLCYGFYTFVLPSNESVVGVVLEDLTESTMRLSMHLHREVAGRRIAKERAKEIVFAAFKLQHRLQNGRLAAICLHPNDLLLLRSTIGTSDPCLVALSFGRTQPLEVRLHEPDEPPKRDGPPKPEGLELEPDSDDDNPEAWRRHDQSLLNGYLAATLEPAVDLNVYDCEDELSFLV